MNCLSKLNTKTFVAAALLAGAGVTFASVGVAKGYNLSPLETYIIESFAGVLCIASGKQFGGALCAIILHSFYD